MSEQDLVKAVSGAKIDSGEGLHQFLEKVEGQTISLLPKAMTFGTRPDLILTTRLVYVNNVLPKRSFWSVKEKKNIEYESKSNGDIFLIDKNAKIYALHLHKYKEIAQAAGIKTSTPRRDDMTYDDNGRVKRAVYSIDWSRLDIDGGEHSGTANGFYDYDQQLEKFKKDGDKEGEEKMNNADKQRGDAEKLGIANAYARAIKDALPEMKLTFTLDELKKPILVPKIIKDLSTLIAKYPDIEKLLLAKELGLADQMYPAALAPNNNQQQLTSAPGTRGFIEQHKEESGNVADAKFTDLSNDSTKSKESVQTTAGQASDEPKPETTKKEEPKPGTQTQQQPAQQKSFEPTHEEKEKIAQKEWAELDQAQRTKQLEELITKKGYKRQSPTPVEKYTIIKQYEMLKMLNNLLDKA